LCKDLAEALLGSRGELCATKFAAALVCPDTNVPQVLLFHRLVKTFLKASIPVPTPPSLSFAIQRNLLRELLRKVAARCPQRGTAR
jgi:hypothetical protein